MADDRTVEDALTVADESGRAIVRVALSLTVYLNEVHSPAARQAIAVCLADYMTRVDDRITWIKHPTTFEWHTATASDVLAVKNWLTQVDPMAGWEFYLHGGSAPDEASDFRISGLGIPSWSPQGLSYLKFVLPVTWFADHQGSMPSFVQQVCKQLQPVSGYAGLSFVDSPSGSLHHLSDPIIYQLAQRHPGIDVDNPASHGLYLGEQIKGVNWLTVLSDPLIERLGGRVALRGHLLPPASLLDYDGGAIVQAGVRPQWGDRDAGRTAPEYRAVNRVLKPLRIASLGLQGGGRGPRFDQVASAAWLNRFD